MSKTRNARGQFAKGNPGKPKGARNRTTIAVEKLLAGEAIAVARACVREAKAGDGKVGIALLRLVAPPPRDRLLQIDLPDLQKAEDAPSALAAIVAAIGAGLVTPTEGRDLAALVDAWSDAHLAHDLQKRVEVLEAERAK